MYELISKLSVPKSYVGKFLLVSFLGIHIPLICIVAYVVVSTEQTLAQALPVLIVGLIATLFGTGLTLWIQRQLLQPITRSIAALRMFRESLTVPDLPTQYEDEAGELMRNTQLTLQEQADLIQMKKDLLSVLSHDIRVHVSGALMIADDLTRIDDLDEVRELAVYLKQSAQKQMTLMNNLLAYSEMERGWTTVNRSFQSVDTFVEDIRQTMAPHAMMKGIRFDVEASVKRNVILNLDLPKTEQILNNLIHNAIKFTEPDGRIVLGVTEDDHRIRFSVTDSGIGMSAEQLATLFSGGTPSSRRGTRKERGTGLGLWICKLYAEAQGGTLAAESEVGRGSTFRLELPNPEPATNPIDA